jgi:hypothetical protein
MGYIWNRVDIAFATFTVSASEEDVTPWVICWDVAQ